MLASRPGRVATDDRRAVRAASGAPAIQRDARFLDLRRRDRGPAADSPPRTPACGNASDTATTHGARDHARPRRRRRADGPAGRVPARVTRPAVRCGTRRVGRALRRPGPAPRGARVLPDLEGDASRQPCCCSTSSARRATQRGRHGEGAVAGLPRRGPAAAVRHGPGADVDRGGHVGAGTTRFIAMSQPGLRTTPTYGSGARPLVGAERPRPLRRGARQGWALGRRDIAPMQSTSSRVCVEAGRLVHLRGRAGPAPEPTSSCAPRWTCSWSLT